MKEEAIDVEDHDGASRTQGYAEYDVRGDQDDECVGVSLLEHEKFTH